MRSAGVIKAELCKLRDLKHLPYAQIQEDSRCSRSQIFSALKLEATEDVLRRLDAYLDAAHLHKPKRRNSELLYRIEQMDRELWRVYGARTKHILTIQDMSVEQQKRHAAAMDFRLKQLLREKIERDTGRKPSFPDGYNYWQCKEHVRRRGAAVGSANRHAGGVRGQGPMGKSRFL